MNAEQKEALWKFIETWTLPILLAVFVLGAIWQLVIVPINVKASDADFEAAERRAQDARDYANDPGYEDDYLDDVRNGQRRD